ncbi:Pseudouridine synthase RluC/RluD [Penicillium manginii]|uniref:Pseudouridine synthase RluC/RluD n=1 Tax=Penicillium manginii TaxID=203109 RepID=UPI002547007E|nr:Pseudouridine synthase RluC/RluD [Penicillium manginii]KAJ5755110.1 Pseudouridine synthase RluC/RluD [Penicillium manginii]
MALVNVEPVKASPTTDFEQPPDVVVTPCDPWPAPYYMEGGFRRVHPYHYTFNTWCKERWRGKRLEDIFVSEFRDRPPEYYRNALDDGLVCVNGKPAGRDAVIKNGQKISHTIHRHEPPVTALPIGIIHEDDDLIVIDKPAGVPVHAAGRYHYNSVTEILRSERGADFLPRPCNRLDRLTSGVMFIAKHPAGALKITSQLQARSVQKEYIARVKGKFPDGVVVCDQPIMQVSPKLGLNRVRATGKEATTKFRRLAYYPPEAAASTTTQEVRGPSGEVAIAATPPPVFTNESEGYSIVHCYPLTGRTHQIRVHLQFLGYPISNDPIYSNRRVFGPELARNEDHGERDEEIMDRLHKMGKTEVADTATYRTHLTAAPNVPPGTNPAVLAEIMAREQQAASEEYAKRKGERLSGAMCEVCGTELYTDPGPHELGLFLHAVAYGDLSGTWKYRSKMPNWGLPPNGLEGPSEVPDWVPVPQDEEIVHGHGTVPPAIGTEDDPPNSGNCRRKKNQGDLGHVLVTGVGYVPISKDDPAFSQIESSEQEAATATSTAAN